MQQFLMACFVLSAIFGIISGLSKTSLFSGATRPCNIKNSENNFYILFYDWHDH